MTKWAKIKQLAESFMSHANANASFSNEPYFVEIPLQDIEELYELAFGPKALFEAKVVRLGKRQNYIERKMNSVDCYKKLAKNASDHTCFVSARKIMEEIEK